MIIVGLLSNGMNTAVTAWRTKASIDKAYCDLLLCLDQIELAITTAAACDAFNIKACYDHGGLSLSFCHPSSYDLSKMSLIEFKLAQLPLDYYYLMNKATPLRAVKGIFMLRSGLDDHISEISHALPSSKATTDRQNDEKEDIYNLILLNVVKFQVSLCGLTNYASTNPEIDYIEATLAPKHFTIDQMKIFDSNGAEIVLDSTPGKPEPKFIDLMIEVIPDILVNKYEKASESMRKELFQRHGVRMNRIIRFN
ncbi:MAG: hypothetical protein LBI37_02475 [Puniceicoccales bacterium]|nr:hypothetical protein [Puniceicoccales bacterium]